MLTAFLRQKGYAVELIDAEVEEWDWPTTAKKIKDINPVIALISVSGTNPSASTPNMIGAGSIFRHLKEIAPEITRVIAGLHPSALPERTLHEEAIDYLVQGEGLYSLPGLIEAIKAGNMFPDIPGTWFRRDGQIVTGPRPPLWIDLDALPMPAWDLLPMKNYRAHNWHCFDHINERQPYVAIYTSLGCPFKCSFCCINSLFGKSGIRYRGPEKVIEEIDFLVNRYGMKNIKIIDEMFALNETRVTEICDRIIERGYDLNIWAYARVNTVTERMLAKMKEAGINSVAYGFESGSKRVLKDAVKGYQTEAVEKVVRMTYDLGLYICANLFLGCLKMILIPCTRR